MNRFRKWLDTYIWPFSRLHALKSESETLHQWAVDEANEKLKIEKELIDAKDDLALLTRRFGPLVNFDIRLDKLNSGQRLVVHVMEPQFSVQSVKDYQSFDTRAQVKTIIAEPIVLQAQYNLGEFKGIKDAGKLALAQSISEQFYDEVSRKLSEKVGESAVKILTEIDKNEKAI